MARKFWLLHDPVSEALPSCLLVDNTVAFTGLISRSTVVLIPASDNDADQPLRVVSISCHEKHHELFRVPTRRVLNMIPGCASPVESQCRLELWVSKRESYCTPRAEVTVRELTAQGCLPAP